MSNNRLAIECTYCHDTFWFGSYSPAIGWGTKASDEEVGHGIRSFMEVHWDCRPNRDADYNADAFRLIHAVERTACLTPCVCEEFQARQFGHFNMPPRVTVAEQGSPR